MEKEKVAEARFGETSQVVLFGNAILTTAALHECLRREIPVTWLSYGGWFLGHTVGTGHRNVETRTAQYARSFERADLPGAGAALGGGQDRQLPRPAASQLAGGRGRRGQSAGRTAAGAAAGYKARPAGAFAGGPAGDRGEPPPGVTSRISAGLLQWRPGSGFDFNGRNRRPPRDPVNALLSFAYAMLTREWTVALAAVGLDPYRGFYHQPRFGRPALALDMMEPFRPLLG